MDSTPAPNPRRGRNAKRDNILRRVTSPAPWLAPLPPAAGRGYISPLANRLPDQLVLLTDLLSLDRVRIPLRARTKDDLLSELVDVVSRGLPASATRQLLAAVRDREQVLSTGIGQGVAIPHGKTPVVDQLRVAAGVTTGPVDFDALDGEPVHLCFLLVGPESAAGAHVKALSRISRLLRRAPLRDALVAAGTPDEFLRLVRDSETA